MSSTRIDFIRQRSQPRLGWLLLAIGFGLLLWRGSMLWQQQQEALQERQKAQVQALAAQAQAERAAASRPQPRAPFFEDKRWQRTARELNFPWVGTLTAVEHTVKPPIYLLALRSAPESGQLSLDGEAPDLDAALAFLSGLQGEPQLSDTALITHEESADSTGRIAVRFSVQTKWVSQP